MVNWRIKKVKPVKQDLGGETINKFNVTIEELDHAGMVIGEYVVGCNRDKEAHIKRRVKKFFKAREEEPPTPPPHPLEGREYETSIA